MRRETPSGYPELKVSNLRQRQKEKGRRGGLWVTSEICRKVRRKRNQKAGKSKCGLRGREKEEEGGEENLGLIGLSTFQRGPKETATLPRAEAMSSFSTSLFMQHIKYIQKCIKRIAYLMIMKSTIFQPPPGQETEHLSVSQKFPFMCLLEVTIVPFL